MVDVCLNFRKRLHLPFFLPHSRESPTRSLTVLSVLPEASVLPSGEKETDTTISSSPLSVATSCRVCASMSLDEGDSR